MAPSPLRSRSLSACRSAAPGSDVQRSAAQVDTEHAPDLGHRVTGEAPIRGCRGEGHEQAGVIGMADPAVRGPCGDQDRKSTRLNSSHVAISYAGFCLKKNIHICI